MAEGQPSGAPPQRRRRPSLPARLLGGGARGARRAAGVAGLDQVAEQATEEAIVRAVESEAVERALVRVLEGPAFEDAVERALESPAVERAAVKALDSELVDHVWGRLLASDEAQQLVERIANAPEVRSAITAQSVGLIEDIGEQVQRVTRRLDDLVERAARRIAFMPRRAEPTDRAGLITRGLAFVLDVALLNAGFFAASALLAIAVAAVLPESDGVSTPALAIGTGAWLLAGAGYLLAFWALAGQTPGMRFLGIQIESGGSRRLGSRRALRRLVGTVLATLPLGAGLLAILYSERRRGLQDRLAGTEVRYSPPSTLAFSRSSSSASSTPA